MKKILSYILIVLTFVQLFAPFTIDSGIKIKKAEADIETIMIEVMNAAVASTTAKIDASSASSEDFRKDVLQTYDTLFLVTKINNIDGTSAGPENRFQVSPPSPQNFKQVGASVGTTANFTELTANTPYLVVATIEGVKAGVTTVIATSTPMTITTLSEGKTDQVSQGSSVEYTDVNGLPTCSINPFNFHLGGCIAQLLYYLFFKPTSFIFGLAGKILDFSIMYSIQDTSYRSTFVVEGWGMVRDFCNMFFIFVLLYIAFGTILNLHSVKTKEMIINVVIIGLLINFSLFATHVIIDASNILTRVFYNQKTIVTGTPQLDNDGKPVLDDDGNPIITGKPGDFGEIQLSSAIVSKVDPQKLIIQASEVSKIPQKGVNEGEVETYGDGISVGGFILVTILATIVNIVGIIAFIASGLIFIARVIGLWLAMILAPLAFFSYTVPALQDMEMIGWKKWWPETLKLAFLAPIFAFFMYLIVGFMDKGLGLADAVLTGTTQKSGLSFVIAIVVPFIFVMILLMKAKDIAKSMSGKIGQSISNGIAAVGGIALGGAALGTAMLGRKAIGETMAKASRGDTLSQKFMDPNKRSNMNWLQKTGGWVGSGFGSGLGINKLHDTLGNKLNEEQKKVAETDHARHIIEETSNKAGFKDIDFNRLSGAQRTKIKETFVRDNKSKWAKDEEDDFRAGKNSTSKTYTDKEALNATETAELKQKVTARAEAEFDKELHHAAESVRGFTRAFTQVNTGSMDVRNLSNLKSDKREGILTRAPVALIAGIATGVRAGIKNSGMSNGGVKVEGNFMKDLGNTISDSLKSMKVSVDLSHVGEHKSSADSHGGGGHH